ncbi:MAG TPA: cytochrome c1, partial [Agrobacterium sp.]|nr:cytochrome c1 [Agrobacterium sp.]
MKKLVTSIALFAAIGCSFTVASAAEESHDLATKTEHAIAGGHFPVIKPEEQSWSFAGPFGKYDKGQLQRGLKVYKEVCSAC